MGFALTEYGVGIFACTLTLQEYPPARWLLHVAYDQPGGRFRAELESSGQTFIRRYDEVMGAAQKSTMPPLGAEVCGHTGRAMRSFSPPWMARRFAPTAPSLEPWQLPSGLRRFHSLWLKHSACSACPGLIPSCSFLHEGKVGRGSRNRRRCM